MAKLRDVGGGARDVAGRGTPAGDAIGPVRRTWAGGVRAGLKRLFVNMLPKNKMTFALKSTGVHVEWGHWAPPRSRLVTSSEIPEEPAAMLKFRFL